MTAIDGTYKQGSQVVALQLLQGGPATLSSKSDKPTFIRSDVAMAGKTASGEALQPARQQREVLAFLSRSGFSTASDDVLQSLKDIFADPALQKEFNENVKAETTKAFEVDHKRITKDDAQLRALGNVIMAHRKLFPAEEFSMSIAPAGYGVEPPMPVTIPSTSNMAAQIFQGDVARMQSDYDDAIAAKNAPPDKDNAKLDAMQQAVSTLVLNGQVVVDQSVADAQAAYAVLTKKLYSDDADDGNSPAAPQTAATHDDASSSAPASA